MNGIIFMLISIIFFLIGVIIRLTSLLKNNQCEYRQIRLLQSQNNSLRQQIFLLEQELQKKESR